MKYSYNTYCCTALLLMLAMWAMLFPLSGCSPKSESIGSYFKSDTLKTLAELPGADMTFYNLYLRQLSDGAIEAASASAETFLNGLDSDAVHPVVAGMAKRLCEYYASEKMLFTISCRWGERAMDIYRRLNDREMVAQVSYLLGKSYTEVNRFDKALLNTLTALSYFEESQDMKAACPCYNQLGQIYYFCQERAISLSYFEQYEQTARALNDTIQLVYSLNNLAIMTGDPSDTLRSRQLLREAARLAHEYNDTIAYFKVIMSQISTYVNANEIDKLERFLPVTSKMPDIFINTKDIITCYYSIGAIYYRLYEFQKAAEALETAINYCKQGEFEYYMQSCYYMLQGVYCHMDNIEKAYESLQSYTRLYRSNLSLQSYLQLFKYQNELLLNQEKEQMTEKRNRQKIIGICAVFTVTLSLICGFVLVWRRNLKVRQKEIELENLQLQQENKEQEIKSQNEIIELQRMQQFQLDRLRKDITGRLLKIIPKYPDMPIREELESICYDLKTDNEGQWKDMSEFVPKFNSDFFRNLIQAHPDLTINERRLCALLNMNLTTKEISDITKQSIHSINIARGRLRSKLGIVGESVSIQEFLAKYN